MKVIVIDPDAPRWKKLGAMEAIEGMVTTTGNIIRNVRPNGFTMETTGGPKVVDDNWTICISETEAQKHGFGGATAPKNGDSDPAPEAPAEVETPAGAPVDAKPPDSSAPAEPTFDSWDAWLDLEVDPARLAWEPEGDIAASYSADAIADGKPVRRPFKHGKYLYVSIGRREGAVHAYRLWPLDVWPGKSPMAYAEHNQQAEPQYDYIGMLVTYKSKPCVLGGPVLKIKERANK